MPAGGPFPEILLPALGRSPSRRNFGRDRVHRNGRSRSCYAVLGNLARQRGLALSLFFEPNQRRRDQMLADILRAVQSRSTASRSRTWRHFFRVDILAPLTWWIIWLRLHDPESSHKPPGLLALRVLELRAGWRSGSATGAVVAGVTHCPSTARNSTTSGFLTVWDVMFKSDVMFQIVYTISSEFNKTL